MITTLTLTDARVTRLDELRYTDGGKAVLNLGVAESDRRYNQAEEKWEDTATLFLDCALWGDWAEWAAANLTVGAPITITGKFSTQRWVDKDTGKNREKIAMSAFRLALRPTPGRDVPKNHGPASGPSSSGRAGVPGASSSVPGGAGKSGVVQPGGLPDGDEPPF